MNKQTPEAILVAALKEDNALAFKEIYRRYNEKVAKMAYFLNEDIEAMKDMVQEVFAALWSARKKIIIKTTLENYLIGITCNKSKNVIKSIGVHKKHKVNYCSNQPTWQAPSKKMEMGEIIEYLKMIVASKCSEREGRAFSYLYFDNLSYQEIASRLDTTVPNCRTYVNRAKKVVWKFIKKFV